MGNILYYDLLCLSHQKSRIRLRKREKDTNPLILSGFCPLVIIIK